MAVNHVHKIRILSFFQDMFTLIFAGLIIAISIATALFQSVRYTVKFLAFAICLMVSGTITSLIQIRNGRTPTNHFLMFKIFIASLWWSGLHADLRNHGPLEEDKPYVVIANHQSAIDVFTLAAMWPWNCVVVLKKSLLFLPGFNLCAWLCNSIFIDRFSREKAHKSLDDALDQIKNHKRKVFLFPEGTRNSKDELLPFKKGAFLLAKEANVPVLPVVFSRYKHFYNHDERRFDYGGKVVVETLEPVHPADFETIEALSDECRRRMTAALDRLDIELGADADKKAN
uniref:1-acyl-sn-glycerol-3-phosphate acyltransferase n=1 Tax=Panagrellus redivivus TaxID=6233 RepID=A0A7E4W1G4_PANRE